MMKLFLGLCLALLASTASADELPPTKDLTIAGGILCDTEDDLVTLLTKTSLNDGKFPSDMGSCGRFVPRSPQRAITTPLYWYEMPDVRVLIGRIFFPGSGWTQFGWLAYEPVTPKSKAYDAL